jgi:hypothetical protein
MWRASQKKNLHAPSQYTPSSKALAIELEALGILTKISTKNPWHAWQLQGTFRTFTVHPSSKALAIQLEALGVFTVARLSTAPRIRDRRHRHIRARAQAPVSNERRRRRANPQPSPSRPTPIAAQPVAGLVLTPAPRPAPTASATGGSAARTCGLQGLGGVGGGGGGAFAPAARARAGRSKRASSRANAVSTSSLLWFGGGRRRRINVEGTWSLAVAASLSSEVGDQRHQSPGGAFFLRRALRDGWVLGGGIAFTVTPSSALLASALLGSSASFLSRELRKSGDPRDGRGFGGGGVWGRVLSHLQR